MKSTIQNLELAAIKRLCGVALACGLCACGGGGGDTEASGTAPIPVSPTVPVSPATSYSAQVSSVAPSSYTITEAPLMMQSNSARQNAGGGLLAQNTALDSAAGGHAAFLVNNQLVSNGAYLGALHEGVLGGHFQDPTLPGVVGFTGKTAQARATAAAYAGTVTELVLFGAVSSADCWAAFENSVYHMGQLFSSALDMGLSFKPGNGKGSACVIVLGMPATSLGQLPPDGGLVAYPYSGQTGVLPTFYNQAETPTPVANLTVAGHPVMVALNTLTNPTLAGSDIVIQSFALSTGSGTPVSVRLLASGGVTSTGPAISVDSNLSHAGAVFLVPAAPLTALTAYSVTFAATVKGRAVSRTWSFTTGAAN